MTVPSLNDLLPETVSAFPSVIAVPDAAGPVNVTPSGIVKVAPVAGGVNATLLSVVAVADPKSGVMRVGDVAKTSDPDPVSSVTAAAKFPLDGVPRKVAMPLPSPETPLVIGNPVQLVRVPDDGVPSAPPLTTGAPAEPILTASAVATPVPSPLMPDATGRPVQLVSVPEVGVPKTGVTSVADVARTTAPVPVTAVMPVPLIWKTFPVPAVLNVLFVSVSAVALPMSVSVAAGRVSVPDAVALAWSPVLPEEDPAKVGVPVKSGD